MYESNRQVGMNPRKGTVTIDSFIIVKKSVLVSGGNESSEGDCDAINTP